MCYINTTSPITWLQYMQDKEIKVLEDTLDKGFHKEEGPFVKGLTVH